MRNSYTKSFKFWFLIMECLIFRKLPIVIESKDSVLGAVSWALSEGPKAFMVNQGTRQVGPDTWLAASVRRGIPVSSCGWADMEPGAHGPGAGRRPHASPARGLPAGGSCPGARGSRVPSVSPPRA